ncbi:hypothetical protein EDI28_25900 [Photobacterium chitinilyticum]|uniref:Uncharacterized protein n=1 Tax=Photobacterium chitinilyticum TaxID=2485123 RepID=A0A444JHY5_9GAMM|nr:hypothetical protein EDI28_25900 [Photobacterium chitinilyticum]
MQVGLAQIVESESELSESGFVACMPQIYHAWKGFRSSMIVLMDGVHNKGIKVTRLTRRFWFGVQRVW